MICNTDAFWIEGPRSNIARLARAFDPEAMDILLLVAASAGAVGVDWPGDFTMDHDGRLEPREPRRVAPFVYTGVGIVKPELFASEPAEVFRLAPFFHAAAAKGRLYGVRLDGLWVHVGRPESIAQAETGDRPVDIVSAARRCISLARGIRPMRGRALGLRAIGRVRRLFFGVLRA